MIGSRVYCMCVGVALLFFVVIFPHFFHSPPFFFFNFSSHPLSVCALACFMTITALCCLVYPAGI